MSRSSHESERTIKPGQRIAGRYRIERLIGQGGMGIVFLAKHEALGQSVALKVLNESAAGDETNVQRFLKEARASARIRGDHVAKVFDVGRMPNRTPYIAMEYLQGEDLAQRLERKGPLPPTEVCGYLLDAIHALAQAHAMGIVHRDLKPPNLFLEQQPAHSPVLKVLDFGIAKMDEGGTASGATSTGTIMGTPAYMAPEQMRSTRSVDARADVWALGVIAYELMSGRLPFAGESLGDILVAVIEKTVLPLHVLASAVPPALSDVVAHCLQREPSNRYPDVVSLAAALEPFAGPAGAGKLQTIRLLATATLPPEAPVNATSSTSPIWADAPTVAAPWSTIRSDATSRRGTWVVAGGALCLVLAGAVGGRMLLAKSSQAATTIPAAPSVTTSAPAAPVPAPTASAPVQSSSPPPTAVADAAAPAPGSNERAQKRRGRVDAPARAPATSPEYTDDPTWGGLPGKH